MSEPADVLVSSEISDTATGLSPRTAATLGYAAWWVSGALFLIIEPTHPYVRFHARQSLIALGLVWLIGFCLWALSFAALFVSVAGFRVTAVLAQVTWAVGVVVWIVCLVQAWRGRWWRVPGMKGRARQG